MGMVQKRKKMHSGDTHLRRRWRTRSRKRDLDQIDKDLQKEPEKLISQDVDLEQTGFGQFYCVHCAKYFIDDNSMQCHFKTKVHKRRMKALEVEPYSIEESERCAGLGSYKAPNTRSMTTQLSKEEVLSGKKMKIELKKADQKKLGKNNKMQE